MPNFDLPRSAVVDAKLIDVLVATGLQPSKGEARRLIRNGGVSLNNEKISDENYSITSDRLIEGRLLLLAAGKKNKMLVRVK
jgi:tyrosyl-tRNA synthetase